MLGTRAAISRHAGAGVPAIDFHLRVEVTMPRQPTFHECDTAEDHQPPQEPGPAKSGHSQCGSCHGRNDPLRIGYIHLQVALKLGNLRDLRERLIGESHNHQLVRDRAVLCVRETAAYSRQSGPRSGARSLHECPHELKTAPQAFATRLPSVFADGYQRAMRFHRIPFAVAGLLAATLAGCATAYRWGATDDPDWSGRVGSATFAQATRELGQPFKKLVMPSGDIKVRWYARGMNMSEARGTMEDQSVEHTEDRAYWRDMRFNAAGVLVRAWMSDQRDLADSEGP
jgi:hypothetical protein